MWQVLLFFLKIIYIYIYIYIYILFLYKYSEPLRGIGIQLHNVCHCVAVLQCLYGLSFKFCVFWFWIWSFLELLRDWLPYKNWKVKCRHHCSGFNLAITSVHVYIYICACVCIKIFLNVCICLYYIYVYVCVYIYIYI